MSGINNYFSNNNIFNGTEIPTQGKFDVGDIIVNIGENAEEEPMWMCIEAGEPGVWKVVGKVEEIDLSGYQEKTDGNLVTESKDLVGAINELFQNVSNGKILIAEALTDRGVEASANETFVELANKILSIPQGVELPMKTPSWTANIDTVTATLDTQDNLFTQFRVNEGAWQTSNVFSGLTGATTYKFEGMYGASRISSISSTSPKANQSAPGVCTASNITQTSVTITAPAGCMIRYNGANYSSPRTFTGVASSYHDFYAYKPATANKNESPVSSGLNVRLRGLGLNSPGPEHLISGTATEGYFGTVNISNYSTISNLATKAGLNTLRPSGVTDSTAMTFLKFIQNGKIIYICKSPTFYRTSGTTQGKNLYDYTKWYEGTLYTSATIDGRNYTLRAPKIGNPIHQTLTFSDSPYTTGYDYNLFVLGWNDLAIPNGYYVPTANRVTIEYDGSSDYGRDQVLLRSSGTGRSINYWSGSTSNMIYGLVVLELN